MPSPSTFLAFMSWCMVRIVYRDTFFRPCTQRFVTSVALLCELSVEVTISP